MANPAPYGLEESFGLMVNYRYDRAKIAANAAAYLADGTHQRVEPRAGPGQDHQALVCAVMEQPTGKLPGTRALVVGASSGVGQGIARELSAAGAHVVLAARQARPPGAGGGRVRGACGLRAV